MTTSVQKEGTVQSLHHNHRLFESMPQADPLYLTGQRLNIATPQSQ